MLVIMFKGVKHFVAEAVSMARWIGRVIHNPSAIVITQVGTVNRVTSLMIGQGNIGQKADKNK